ncbi:hypothetical protein L615_004600000180 [Nocardioides sp. J9]|uniref:hypothetical protein n=1 Tax=Nocardioides sp. J9 TaxID=935844 RepID=UPI0011A5125C|nr:hypothetical protein [Nocardioides sp. J9]TWG95923.1 hypothetical protein L615_004600000180 [Nocardioides sp. J9]
MTRLLRVELRRYLHRRAVVLLLAGCLAAPVLIGVSTWFDTRPASDAEIASAQAEVERAKADGEYRQAVDDCVANPMDWGITARDENAVREECRAQNEPQLDWFLYSPELDLDEQQSQSGVAVASLLAILLLLAGTTFTGHDWNSGSVSNQLLFEPRRPRVWTAKAVVVTGVALVVAAVVMTAYWSGLAAVAEARGVLRDGQLVDALQMGWRSAGVAATAALLGYALTMLFRSTVATIGVLLGASVAGSLVLLALGFDERWNPGINIAALIDNGATYYSDEACEAATEDGEYVDYGPCEAEVTFTDASLYTGSFLLLSGVASFASFRRRDVP